LLDRIVYMKKYYYFFIAFFLGIALCNSITWWLLVFLFAVFFLFVVVFFLGTKSYVFIILFGFCLGIGRVWFGQVDLNDSGRIAFYNGDKVKLSGVVMDVDRRINGVKMVVDAKFENNGREGIHGTVLVKTRRYPEFKYGDLLEINGKLKEPENFNGFDYRRYLAKDGIYSVMVYPRLRKIAGERGNVFYAGLMNLREWFESRLNQMLPEPHASFMAGLLIGARKGIPRSVLDDFQKTGLTHIIAISGYNITLLIIFIAGALKFLRRKWQVLISVLVIVVFTLFVGASAAVVRAAIMGILGLMALWVGRKGNVLLLVSWSGFFMVMWNPLVLIVDVGFQLSFLAVLSLIFVMPLMERYFKWMPEKGGLREAFVTTLAAQVLVLPVILINFGQLSLISPIANVFVVPWIPLVMMSGFLMVVFSLFFMPLAWVMQAITWFVLKLMLICTKMFAAIPFAAIQIGWFGWGMALIYYYFVVRWIRRNELFEFI